MTGAALPSETLRAPPEFVSISELRAHLAEIVGRVERGEEVVIARGRQPVAKLVPLRDERWRRLGVLKELMSEQALAALAEGGREAAFDARTGDPRGQGYRCSRDPQTIAARCSMQLLLDSHALCWTLTDDSKLSEKVRTLILDNDV